MLRAVTKAPDSAREALLAKVLIAFAALLALVEGPAQIAAVAAILAALFAGRARGWRPGWVELGLLLWIFAGIPGTVSAGGGRSSADVTRPLLALTLFAGAWGVARADERALRAMAWAFAVGCVINGAYGLVQVRFGALPLDPLFLKNPSSAQLWVPDRVYHERAAAGLFYNRLKLAHVGLVGLALLGLVALGGAVRPWRSRVLAAAGAAMLGAALVLTYARMALVALVAAGLLLAMLLGRARAVLAVLAAVALLGVGFALSTHGALRIASLGADLEIRRAMFAAAWALFEGHPLLGVGHGMYSSLSAAHMPPHLEGVLLTSPHNLWLQVLAETGVVGFVGFNAAVGVALVRLGRRVHRARGLTTAVATLDRLALVAMVALLLIGLMHFTLHHVPVALLFWTLAGVAVRSPGGPPAGEAQLAGAAPPSRR